jgi:hypothetical protein
MGTMNGEEIQTGGLDAMSTTYMHETKTCTHCNHPRSEHNRERGCVANDGACTCYSGDGIRKEGKGEYTQNYLEYCAQAGRTPEEQKAHDRAQYPGGSMTGFILWVSGKRAAKGL